MTTIVDKIAKLLLPLVLKDKTKRTGRKIYHNILTRCRKLLFPSRQVKNQIARRSKEYGKIFSWKNEAKHT
jgi:hypothetical protein